MNSHQSVFERLGLSEDCTIALGTLRLDSVLRIGDTNQEQQQLVASTSASTIWTPYRAGALQDNVDIQLEQRRRQSKGVTPSSSSKSSSPGKGKGSTLKRKVPSSSASSLGNASNASTTAGNPALQQPKVPLPTLKEIDHLVKNAFILAEYTIIASPHQFKKEEDIEHNQQPLALPTSKCTCIFRIRAIPLDAPGLNSRIEALHLKIRNPAAKSLAQKTFTKLLYHLHADEGEWMTGLTASSTAENPSFLLPRNPNTLSILEVYNKLEDPKPQHLEGLTPAAQDALDDILREDAPEGMSSRLFEFQKTCLWKLAARELAPQNQIDLSFQEYTSIDPHRKTRYYIDSNNLVWNTAQYYLEPKAAIVSEGMGTGKTCICLALILSTKYQLAKIEGVREESFGRISTIRTRRSEKFPWVTSGDEVEPVGHVMGRLDREQRQRGGTGDVEMLLDGQRTLKRVPTLSDLTLDLITCSTHFRALPTMHGEGPTKAWKLPTTTNDDLPYVWEIPLPKGRDDTRSTGASKRKVYISATTLVIVPDILVAQWLSEIQKHVKEGALDYIKLEKDDHVPDEMDLAKLDLVLVSESKIRAEESRFWMLVTPPCRCPYIGNTRAVACRCKKVVDYGISPLVGVWWKRLIVDEGHKVAGNGELVQMCMRLRTESRYVVSGTPSKNLVGLHDVGTVEQNSHEIETSAEGDKNDFERLARICNFIGMQPFCSDPALFMKAFHEPYRIRGDTTGIEGFFARTMVRHRVPDVAMPPLTRSTVVLEFNELERITYNVLLALFISNSVLSERQDEDYFFHPKNKGHLSSLLSNLGAAHLLFSSSELVKSAMNSYNTNIKAITLNRTKGPYEKRWSTEDVQLIDQAQHCFKVAFEMGLWKVAQKGSMLYAMERREVAPELLKMYDGFALEDPSLMAFTGERLTSLRYQIGKLARDPEWELKSGEELEEELITIAAKERQSMMQDLLDHRDKTKPIKGAKPPPKKKRQTSKDKVSATKAASGAFKKNSGDSKDVFTYEHLPLTSHLDQVHMPSIASTKVAYVVKSIMTHSTEKFLVFAGGSSSSAHVASNNLFYLAEALDLANIPFLIFARSLSQEKLAAYAKAFSESTVFRVLLLDLKFAGRGLTLSKATRIIFTEPIWHKDEEAQAVKRAHRLGQDRPVHVETLVMKDSFEEKVFSRGAQLSRRETAGAKTPYQDTQLSAALRDLRFLPGRSEGSKSFFSPLNPPLRLIPSFLHDAERQDLDVELARFRQQAQDDLAAQLECHSRGGSVSRSRSATPAGSRERSRSATPATIKSESTSSIQTAASDSRPLQVDFKPRQDNKPRLPSALKFVSNVELKADSSVLMSQSSRYSDDSTSSDEDVVVVTSRRTGVHFG